jgi:hypothetical protein
MKKRKYRVKEVYFLFAYLAFNDVVEYMVTLLTIQEEIGVIKKIRLQKYTL